VGDGCWALDRLNTLNVERSEAQDIVSTASEVPEGIIA
jgi:hypothetical protein